MRFIDHIFSPATWPHWLFFLSSTALLCLYFFRRERKLKAATVRELKMRQSLTKLELRAFQAQLDPHFIFNSLNAIHHYILTTSTDMASLYLTRFSKLMRLVIANFNREWVSLQDDLEALELYIQLEQLRFEPQFAYQLHLDPDLGLPFVMIPPLIIQPYVQQAIWHRILQRPQKSDGCLKIMIYREHDRLYIQLEDNGICDVPLHSDNAAQLSKSVAIAAERLHGMGNKYHLGANVSEETIYDDEQQPCGCRITISLPYITNRRLEPVKEEKARFF